MTARDGSFSTEVIDQISGRFRPLKATSATAFAASVAYPLRQEFAARRQPISWPPAPGVPAGIGLRPVNPMNSPVSRRSSAQRPKPCRSSRASMRSANASLISRSRRAGKYRMTSGSAFITANGARSDGSQRRRISRSV